MKLQFAGLFVLFSLPSLAQDLYPTFTYRKASDSIAWTSAWEKYENGRYKEAINVLDKLPRAYRADAATYRLKALCLTELKEYTAALYWLGGAMLEAPDNYGLLKDRAQVRYYQKDYRAQAADLAAYLHFVKDDTAAIYNYVLAVMELGEYEKGTAMLETFEFKDAGLHALSGECYLQQGMFNTAVYALNAGLEVFPQDTYLHTKLVIAHFNLSEYDLALETTEKLIALAPEDGYSYALRGWIYEEMDRMFDARVSFELAEYYGYEFDYEDEEDDEDEGDYY